MFVNNVDTKSEWKVIKSKKDDPLKKVTILNKKGESCFGVAQKMNSNSSQLRERVPKPLYAYYALPAYGLFIYNYVLGDKENTQF